MAQRSTSAATSIVDPVSRPPQTASGPCVVTPYLTGRRLGNRLLALLLLVAAAPIIAILALAIRVTSPGPVFFRQVRVGKGGRPFTMLKLRTMIEGAESLRPGAWTRAEDPRITAFGRRLRLWHLDELPQLANVVRGEMALVGPRPERPEIAAELGRLVDGYEHRQRVLPGIVGLSQINLPPDTSIDSVRRKLRLDLEYLRTAGPALDLRMIAWSCARLIGVPFDLATGYLGLARDTAAGAPADTPARASNAA
jgi:lipopolysaccharide/colanic/teichoic acid biosynthesis glycosyltransferase